MVIIKNVLALGLIFLLGLPQINEETNVRDSKNLELNTPVFKSYISPCHPSNEENRDIIENFIVSPDWSSERQSLGITDITTAQIKVVSKTNEGNVCQELNSEYQETISKKRHTGEPRYNLTYYKASNFYFVTISLRQPDDSSEVVVGLSYLDIYDQNLNRLKGYSF